MKNKNELTNTQKTLTLAGIANLFFVFPSLMSGRTILTMLVCNLGLGYYLHQIGKNQLSAQNLCNKMTDSTAQIKNDGANLVNKLFNNNKKSALQTDYTLSVQNKFRNAQIIARNVTDGGAVVFDNMSLMFQNSK